MRAFQSRGMHALLGLSRPLVKPSGAAPNGPTARPLADGRASQHGGPGRRAARSSAQLPVPQVTSDTIVLYKFLRNNRSGKGAVTTTVTETPGYEPLRAAAAVPAACRLRWPANTNCYCGR